MNRSHFLLLVALAVALGSGAWLARDALLAQEKPAPAAPAVRWEYKLVSRDELTRLVQPDVKPASGVVDYGAIQKGLDQLGADSWELAAVEPSSHDPRYFFKRPRTAK